jgi:hypothetical protein
MKGRPLQHRILLALAGLTTACSSTSTESAPTPAATAAVTTSAAAPTTTIAVGPTPSSPTAATTAPSAIDPAVEQAVKQAVQDFFVAYMACGQAPATCHPADFHSERGTAVGQGTVYFATLAKRGEYFGPDTRGSYVVTQSVVLENPTSAIAYSCLYDASILLGPPDTTGGAPKVLNDKLISVRQKQALYFDGTDWKVGEAATVQDLGDGNRCPPQ